MQRWLRYGLFVGLACFFLALIIMEPPDQLEVPCSVGANERTMLVEATIRDLAAQASIHSWTTETWVERINERAIRPVRCGPTVGVNADHASGRIGLEMVSTGEVTEWALTIPGPGVGLDERRLIVIRTTRPEISEQDLPQPESGANDDG